MSRQSTAFSSATPHAMSQNFEGKWGMDCLNTRFPLPTQQCAGNNVKLIYILIDFIIIIQADEALDCCNSLYYSYIIWIIRFSYKVKYAIRVFLTLFITVFIILLYQDTKSKPIPACFLRVQIDRVFLRFHYNVVDIGDLNIEKPFKLSSYYILGM